MPVNWTRYPANWRQFSAEIRLIRAMSQCECTGQCGMHRPNPNPRRCCELHHRPARWFRGYVRLTVAHLCTCDPPCTIAAHVIAACQRCHLRIDRYKHATHRLATQTANKHRDLLRFRPPGEPPWSGCNPTKADSLFNPKAAFPWHPAKRRALPLLERSSAPATPEPHL